MQEDIRGMAARFYLQSLIISIALPAGVLLFAAVSWFVVSTQGPVFDPGLSPVIYQAIAVLTVGLAMVAGQVGRLVQAQTGADTPAQVAQGHLTGFLMAAGLREGSGLVGGLMILAGQSLMIAAAMVGVSVVLGLMNLPDRQELETRLRRATLNSGEALSP